jgi:hydrogenase expression/formation protein HypE
MAAASRDAGVPIVTGDTKVVEKGKADGVFITTTGVGVVPAGVNISGDRARPGDRIIVSGSMGDHGMAIMSLRENLSFGTSICSDTAALHGLVAAMVARRARHPLPARPHPRRPGHHAQRTRAQSGCGMLIAEAPCPCGRRWRPPASFWAWTRCTSANEGKLIAICDAASADACWP